jgi:hypothetical protein
VVVLITWLVGLHNLHHCAAVAELSHAATTPNEEAAGGAQEAIFRSMHTLKAVQGNIRSWVKDCSKIMIGRLETIMLVINGITAPFERRGCKPDILVLDSSMPQIGPWLNWYDTVCLHTLASIEIKKHVKHSNQQKQEQKTAIGQVAAFLIYRVAQSQKSRTCFWGAYATPKYFQVFLFKKARSGDGLDAFDYYETDLFDYHEDAALKWRAALLWASPDMLGVIRV